MRNKKNSCGAILLLLVCLLGISGCQKESEADPAAMQVIGISITPTPSPTPRPEEENPQAVVRNGTYTMTNEYLLQKAQQDQKQDLDMVEAQ